MGDGGGAATVKMGGGRRRVLTAASTLFHLLFSCSPAFSSSPRCCFSLYISDLEKQKARYWLDLGSLIKRIWLNSFIQLRTLYAINSWMSRIRLSRWRWRVTGEVVLTRPCSCFAHGSRVQLWAFVILKSTYCGILLLCKWFWKGSHWSYQPYSFVQCVTQVNYFKATFVLSYKC